MAISRIIVVEIAGKVRHAKAKFPASLFSKKRDKKGQRKILKSKMAEYDQIRRKLISAKKYKLCKYRKRGCLVKGMKKQSK